MGSGNARKLLYLKVLKMLRELMVFEFQLNRITDDYIKAEYSQLLELLINLCPI